MAPSAMRRMAVACGVLTLIALCGGATWTGAQLNVPDLVRIWSSPIARSALEYAKEHYNAEVLDRASQGIIVAPVRNAPNIAAGIPERGVAIGFLMTFGTYALPSRYELVSGTYAVVLRRAASGLVVEFRNAERTIVDSTPPLIQNLPAPARTPNAGLQSGRPCYDIDSRRICP
jgi:hypothetical protein